MLQIKHITNGELKNNFIFNDLMNWLSFQYFIDFTALTYYLCMFPFLFDILMHISFKTVPYIYINYLLLPKLMLWNFI